MTTPTTPASAPKSQSGSTPAIRPFPSGNSVAPSLGAAGRNAARLADATRQRFDILQRSFDPGGTVRDDTTSEPTEGTEDAGRLRDRLRSEGGRGRMLSEEIRTRLRPFLTFDPSIARIHRGAVAAREAGARRAQAFTVGTDIFFGERRFSPETRHGLGLLAHEMTHVGQQSRLLARAEPRHFTSAGGDRMEQEAQDVAKRVLAAFSFPAPPLQPRTLQRPSLMFAVPTVATPAPRETAPSSFIKPPISSPLPLANPESRPTTKESHGEAESDPKPRSGPIIGSHRTTAAPTGQPKAMKMLSARHADANAVSDRVYRLMRRELLLAKERSGK